LFNNNLFDLRRQIVHSLSVDEETPLQEPASPAPEAAGKKSDAVFDRRSVVFGPGDIELLDELVWAMNYHKWGVHNRSTVIRALIHIASEAYGKGQVFPRTEPWALHLHERFRHFLNAIKAAGAKRGPKA